MIVRVSPHRRRTYQNPVVPQSFQPVSMDARLMLEQEVTLARNAERLTKQLALANPGRATIDPTHQVIEASAVGNNIIVPGSSGFRIAIYQLSLYNSVGQTIQLLDGTAGAKLQGDLTNFPAGAGYYLPMADQDNPHFVLGQGNSFILNLGAGAVGGFVKYRMLDKWQS